MDRRKHLNLNGFGLRRENMRPSYIKLTWSLSTERESIEIYIIRDNFRVDGGDDDDRFLQLIRTRDYTVSSSLDSPKIGSVDG